MGGLTSIFILASEHTHSLSAARLASRVARGFFEHKNEPVPESRLIRLDNLVIICEPNAGLMELHALDPRLIRFFLGRRFSVIIWNYQGFNFEDNFSTTLSVASPDHEGRPGAAHRPG